MTISPEEKPSYFPVNLGLWVLCFVIDIITFLFIHYKIRPSSRTMALHYNVFVGVNLYGKGNSLYSLPLAGFIITIINLVLYRTLKNSRYFLVYLTLFVSLLTQASLLLAVLFLTKVN